MWSLYWVSLGQQIPLSMFLRWLSGATLGLCGMGFLGTYISRQVAFARQPIRVLTRYALVIFCGWAIAVGWAAGGMVWCWLAADIVLKHPRAVALQRR